MSDDNQEALAFFSKYIEDKLGIVYDESNFFQLENRLKGIAKLEGLEGIPDLYRRAQGGIFGSFERLLLDIATNNETSFFRDKAVFEAFKSTLVPEVIEAGNKIVKIWCAACSTGQEPYSLAMILEEMGAQVPDYKIKATDFSKMALEQAQAGRYNQVEVQRGLSAFELVKTFKKQEDGSWLINDTLKRKISFEEINLLETFKFADRFEIVFCRNVLIYQNVERKKKIIDRIADHIVEGGHLILGASEHMIGLSDRFEQRKIGKSIVFKKLK